MTLGNTADTAPLVAPKAAAGPSGVYQATDCTRVGAVVGRIGDKWSIQTVVLLGGGSRRFNDIKRMLGSISQRMLTLTLRSLERDGLVTRTVFPTVPARVEYALTDLGRSLRQTVAVLGTWALAHHDEIVAAQRDFDRRTPERAAH